MGAGTSAGDAARSRRGAGQATARDTAVPDAVAPVRDVPEPVAPAATVDRAEPATPVGESRVGEGAGVGDPVAGGSVGGGSVAGDSDGGDSGGGDTVDGAGEPSGGAPAEGAGSDGADAAPAGRTRRFPTFTRDTARPEGGGRAAPRDAPAPARQWPLLSVLGTTGLGLLIVGLHPFPEASRIGTILIGVALIGAAVLRRVMPSVGMLAVRSRFTDMVTYGLLGVAIVMLSLMTQPEPWLEIPFLEDIVHSTVP
ncbi:DUF3017 domain-containing protein [Streptomyces sp. NPDC058200]|uniref:DUF3017 domain-containing protein n=1 Tax=Streptomyces sp. NPDC058200 TaxID=3346378 RepID=UPI0036DFE9F3